jgi:hypothetical protein
MKRFITRAGAWPLALVILIVAIGVVTAAAVAATSTSPDPTEIMPAPGPDGAAVDRQIPGNQSPAHLSTTFAPRPDPLPVAGTGPEFGTHWAGQTFHNQRRNADGGNQLSLEPPDQGLCAGNGQVIETVNDIVATYDAATGAKTSPISSDPTRAFESLNQFYIGDHQIDRTPPIRFGTFLSDPRCLYDASTGRFFMTILSFGRDPVTGAFQAPGKLWIATSKTGTATADPSDWNIFSIDVTNDGRNGEQSHPGCPCFGDQPLVGIDANGVYITTNEFPINGPGFNGAQIYAIQKSALEAGTTPNVVRIEGAPIASTGYGNGIPYSLQPTSSPSAGDFAGSNNGTEYLLGALEFGKKPFQLDNRLAVWALTNTASLNTTPALTVKNTIISSQIYGLPPAIVQPKGPTPQADALKEHENLLDGGDDRMQAAVYAHGHLWGAADTIVKTPTRGVQVGVAYYMVSPSVNSAGVPSGTVTKQGYVSVNGNSVTRPSLGVTSSGKVVLGASLIGPDYFPSAAYATFDDSASSAPTTLHVAAAATVPADGFSGYRSNGGSGIERWGDYGFAAADGNSVWVANEWIPGLNQAPDLAAWGTYVSKITP